MAASKDCGKPILGIAPLELVGLLPQSGKPIDGLVSVRKPPRNIAINEAVLTRQLQSLELVDFVYFRRFIDSRESQPAALVIDNSDDAHSEQEIAKVHHHLWLAGVAPIIYVAWPSRIDILSCARQADFWRDGERIYSPAESLEVAANVESELTVLRRLSAGRLADGSFWEDAQNQKLADHENAAHESLIRSVVEADRELDGESNPIARRLLLLAILLKYLEDRGVFPSEGWFGRFGTGARSFLDLLRDGEPENVANLLKFLEDRFNGDVFSFPPGTRLTKKSLRSVAKLVEAKTLDGQKYLWELYSFAYLPVEVISHLYDRFVQGSTAVYTPPFLADLLLSFAMPFDKLTGRESVLDPACGSGVFLVGAFKRLIGVWRSRHRWATPDVEILKKILREQIFGIELQSVAIDLTAFSLSLAICDALQPNVIWEQLRFDKLRGKNLLETDFFDFSLDRNTAPIDFPQMFHVVIGNPPFESRFSDAAAKLCAYLGEKAARIPDKQVAYLFLDQCFPLVEKSGRLCLIQSSNFLYNVNSHGFRSCIVQSKRIEALLDFTSVRGLFEGADVKTVAIVAGPCGGDKIDHFTFRRTFRTAEKLGFELDHYDRHQLDPEEIVAESRAARANLLGGGRLREIAARIRRMRTLEAYVNGEGWLMGEGYVEGNGGLPAPHLTGERLLPTPALSSDEIDDEQLETVTSSSFYRPGRPELFDSPLILIKEHESLPIAYWDKGKIAYKNEIVGIRCTGKGQKAHRELFTNLIANAKFLRFALLVNGARALVGKATAVLKNDIDQLPYPTSMSDAEFTDWEQAIADDVLNHMASYVRLGQNSEILKKAADPHDLATYAGMYCRMLGSVYDNIRPAESVLLNGLICQPFYFGEAPLIEWLGPDCEEQLKRVVFEETLPSLRTVRVVRFYEENVIFIVKPDRLRYWLLSTAIWDADDTLTDLQHQGY